MMTDVDPSIFSISKLGLARVMNAKSPTTSRGLSHRKGLIDGREHFFYCKLIETLAMAI